MNIGQLGSVPQPGSTVSSVPTPVAGIATQAGAAGSVAGGTAAAAAAYQTSNVQSPAQSEPSIGQVNQAVQKINAALSAQSQGIEFAVDSSSHRVVVEVFDQKTHQVIRQYPSKEALAIADSLNQDPNQVPPQGLLIKQQA